MLLRGKCPYYHYIPESCQYRSEGGVSIVDVEVVPSTLGGELVELEPQGLVLSGVHQPHTLVVLGVITVPVRDDSLRVL